MIMRMMNNEDDDEDAISIFSFTYLGSWLLC